MRWHRLSPLCDAMCAAVAAVRPVPTSPVPRSPIIGERDPVDTSIARLWQHNQRTHHVMLFMLQNVAVPHKFMSARPRANGNGERHRR